MNLSARTAALAVIAFFTLAAYLLLQTAFTPAPPTSQSIVVAAATDINIAAEEHPDHEDAISTAEADNAADAQPVDMEGMDHDEMPDDNVEVVNSDPPIDGEPDANTPDEDNGLRVAAAETETAMGEMDHSTMATATLSPYTERTHTMPLRLDGVAAATVSQGAQPLEFRMEDGYKVFDLTAQPVVWNILDELPISAWSYNGMIPGPTIRVTEGDRIRVNLTNRIDEPTTIHWQSMGTPLSEQGIPDMTQGAVNPGDTFTYEFTADTVGTFMYYPEANRDVQISLGLYGAFIVDGLAEDEENAPTVDVTLMLSEWRVSGGLTFPAASLGGSEPNYFTVNGKAFPNTEPIRARVGERVRLRVYGIGSYLHPLHLQGFPFEIVGVDGYPLPAAERMWRDTLLVAPGDQYDVEFTPDRAGRWMLRCNIASHTMNNFGLEEGGLVVAVEVSE